MNQKIENLIKWFFEKGYNGNITSAQALLIQMIAFSKYIDAAMEIGSSNGLVSLLLKGASLNTRIEVIDFDKKRLDNAKAVHKRASLGGIFYTNSEPEKTIEKMRQYDLVFINLPAKQANYEKYLEDCMKHLIVDALVLIPLNGQEMPNYPGKPKFVCIVDDLLFLRY